MYRPRASPFFVTINNNRVTKMPTQPCVLSVISSLGYLDQNETKINNLSNKLLPAYEIYNRKYNQLVWQRFMKIRPVPYTYLLKRIKCKIEVKYVKTGSRKSNRNHLVDIS